MLPADERLGGRSWLAPPSSADALPLDVCRLLSSRSCGGAVILLVFGFLHLSLAPRFHPLRISESGFGHDGCLFLSQRRFQADAQIPKFCF